MTEKTNQEIVVAEETTSKKANAFTAKQKLILALCSIVAVTAIVITSVFATLAYLTSSAAVSNVFTVGNVQITMTESKVDANGKIITGEGAAQVDTNTYHLVPDKTYDKDPKITVGAGSENSYLFVLVRNDISGIADTTDPVNKPTIAQQMERNGWQKYTKASTGWIYIYVGVNNVPAGDAAATESSFDGGVNGTAAMLVQQGVYPLFTQFSIAKDKDTSTYGAAKITLTAVAIQQQGFETVNEAWAEVVNLYPYIHTGAN